MNLEKLFKVLVMGGALIGCDAEAPSPDAAASDAAAVDATDAVAVDATEGMETDAMVDGGEALCFCPADCCDGPTPKPGIECCWSTSC
jgi:hypothetical protein